MGQEAEVFAKNGIVIDEWQEADAPARRRRWHDAGNGTHAVLLASASDVDDLIPTLVAFQIEWNKIRVRQRAAGWPPDHEPAPDECAEVLGGTAEDWGRLRGAWGDRFGERLRLIADRRMNLRVRMLGGTQVGYARMTRRWWTPVHDSLTEQGLADRPLYFVSSNTHSLVNIATGVAREREDVLVEFVETLPEDDILRDGAGRLPGGARRGLVGELPLLRGPALLRLARRGGPRGAAALGGRVRRLAHPQHHGAARAGSDHPAVQAAPGPDGPAARRGGCRRARGRRGSGREHRLSARRGRLQHPARGGRGQLDAARRLRARQGGDAERRRGRRDALDASSTTSTRARPTGSTTPSAWTTSRPTCASAAASTTSARSP